MHGCGFGESWLRAILRRAIFLLNDVEHPVSLCCCQACLKTGQQVLSRLGRLFMASAPFALVLSRHSYDCSVDCPVTRMTARDREKGIFLGCAVLGKEYEGNFVIPSPHVWLTIILLNNPQVISRAKTPTYVLTNANAHLCVFVMPSFLLGLPILLILLRTSTTCYYHVLLLLVRTNTTSTTG